MRYKFNKRNRVKRLRALAKAMREVWAIKRKCKQNECTLEQEKPLDSPSKLYNLVSVPVFEDKSVLQQLAPDLALDSTQQDVSTDHSVSNDVPPSQSGSDGAQSPDTAQGSLECRTLRVRPEPAHATSENGLLAVRRYYRPRSRKKKSLAAKLIDSSLVDGRKLLKKKRGRPLAVKTVTTTSVNKTNNRPKRVKQYDNRLIIAKVYFYLQNEYECLKVLNGDRCDLSPLANILQRTARAIGVSEQTIAQILEETKGLNVALLEEEKQLENGERSKGDCADPDVEVVGDTAVDSIVYPIKEEVIENQHSKHFESSTMTVEEYETNYDDLLLPVKTEPVPEYRSTTKNMLLLASPLTVRHPEPEEQKTEESTTDSSDMLYTERQSIAAHITNHRHHVPDGTEVKTELPDVDSEEQCTLEEDSTVSPITIIVC